MQLRLATLLQPNRPGRGRAIWPERWLIGEVDRLVDEIFLRREEQENPAQQPKRHAPD